MIIDGKRALAHVQKIAWIRPIEGADNIELIGVLGWCCIAKKGEFQVGDMCVYFEIDSKLPETEWSEFMRAKHFKVKTMKLGKFKVVSQGLALPLSMFDCEIPAVVNTDVTDLLGVTYSVVEDNKRKADGGDKYKKMAARRPEIFSKPWACWMMKREWGKKVMFFFFGKKKDRRGSWPEWVVKTDEERVQNMPWILEDKTPWYATEKIDGTSTTFTLKRRNFGKREFLVCSRNVVFDVPNKKCFYDTNVYLEMAKKYDMEMVLNHLMDLFDADFVTIQGETYGEGIQKRTYGLSGHDFMVFNLIVGEKNGNVVRFNPAAMTLAMKHYDIPCVPVVDECFVMPDTVEELLNIATDASAIDGGMREGLVFRSADGEKSFKAVSNEFLMKYHS